MTEPSEQVKDHRERALTAIDAANQNLRAPAGGSYESAQVCATLAVAEAILAVEELLREGPPFERGRASRYGQASS